MKCYTCERMFIMRMLLCIGAQPCAGIELSWPWRHRVPTCVSQHAVFAGRIAPLHLPLQALTHSREIATSLATLMAAKQVASVELRCRMPFGVRVSSIEKALSSSSLSTPPAITFEAQPCSERANVRDPSTSFPRSEERIPRGCAERCTRGGRGG